MNRFRFIKVREVVSPNRANPNDAGLDFYVPTNLYPEDIHSKNEFDSEGYDLDVPFGEAFVRHIALKPGHRILTPSGIKGLLEPPASMLMAANKSGIATKKGLIFTAEIVDSPYVGEIHIGIYNTSQEIQVIEAGQKLVQFIPAPTVASVSVPETCRVGMPVEFTVVTDTTAANISVYNTYGS